MLSFQLLSIQVDISWKRKEFTNKQLEHQIRINEVEKAIEEVKAKNFEWKRII